MGTERLREGSREDAGGLGVRAVRVRARGDGAAVDVEVGADGRGLCKVDCFTLEEQQKADEVTVKACTGAGYGGSWSRAYLDDGWRRFVFMPTLLLRKKSSRSCHQARPPPSIPKTLPAHTARSPL